jgi:hypothetical protein
VKKKTKARRIGRVIKMKTKAEWVKFLRNSYPGYHPGSIDEDELDASADRWFKHQEKTVRFFHEKGNGVVEVLRRAITQAAFTNRVVALDIDLAQNILTWLEVTIPQPPGNAKTARKPLFDLFDIKDEQQAGRLSQTAETKEIAGHMMSIWNIKEDTARKAVTAALNLERSWPGTKLATK